MKEKIHPNYYADATTRCLTCGTEFNFGTTSDSLTVAICSHCHPFYTGEQHVVIDTSNKISSYKEKMHKVAELMKRAREIEAKRKEREKNRTGVISRRNEEKITLKDLLLAKDKKK